MFICWKVVLHTKFTDAHVMDYQIVYFMVSDMEFLVCLQQFALGIFDGDAIKRHQINR